jgi:hypothetical protein
VDAGDDRALDRVSGSHPVADVEKPPLGSSGDIEVFSPEEVWPLGP